MDTSRGLHAYKLSRAISNLLDYEILIKKLDMYGISSSASNLFRSYLINRIQMCSINGELSNPRTVKCGIPQGSILGPLLFLIYINDLANCLEHSSTRMFADDTTLTTSGSISTKLNQH